MYNCIVVTNKKAPLEKEMLPKSYLYGNPARPLGVYYNLPTKNSQVGTYQPTLLLPTSVRKIVTGGLQTVVEKSVPEKKSVGLYGHQTRIGQEKSEKSYHTQKQYT